MSFKSGFVAIIGQPNAGKSTLLNALLSEKVAIVSDKAQTTRQSIRGILTTAEYQIVFVDTPGIHEPKDEFGRFLNKTSYGAIEGCEVIYFVSDATRCLNAHELKILDRLKQMETQKVFCLVNKIDVFNKTRLIEILTKYQAAFPFDEIIPLSAKTKDNLAHLLDCTLQVFEEGPLYFRDNEVVDYHRSFQLREIIREKVLFLTNQEIPHLTEVQIENLEETDDELVIDALLVVSKASMKPILIGKQGQMISKITQLAKREIKQLYQKKVILNLYVRVEKDWRSKLAIMKDLGYQHE